MTIPLTDPRKLPDPKPTNWLFHDRRFAPAWLLVRLYVGLVWLSAGWEKLVDPGGLWVGRRSGFALAGFVNGALLKTAGEHPDVSGWYAAFLEHAVLPHAALFSLLVTFGELCVGLALLAGLFTGVAAFFGGFMNLAFLMAGTVSVNPQLFVLSTGVVLAWRIAGHWGLDRWVLPRVGVPGAPGPWLRRILRPVSYLAHGPVI